MVTYFFPLVAVLALVLSGCATTGSKSAHEQLQTRVVELEKKLEEKDAEIVDLQYEVKDLSGKVESVKAEPVEETESDAAPVKSTTGDDILRVNVSVEKLQTALKNAGLYTGKVDGKIGAGTKLAIKEFQKSHGLKSDGVVGKKTWDELKAYLK